MTNNYVFGRNKENQRLYFVQRERYAVLGTRFYGSKIGKSWIKLLRFNPKVDIIWVDRNGVVYFEQLKSARQGNKPRISKDEIDSVKRLADIFRNNRTVWVGYVLKEYRKPWKEYRLN